MGLEQEPVAINLLSYGPQRWIWVSERLLMSFGWRNSFPERIARDGRTAETVRSKCTGKWEEAGENTSPWNQRYERKLFSEIDWRGVKRKPHLSKGLANTEWDVGALVLVACSVLFQTFRTVLNCSLWNLFQSSFFFLQNLSFSS